MLSIPYLWEKYLVNGDYEDVIINWKIYWKLPVSHQFCDSTVFPINMEQTQRFPYYSYLERREHSTGYEGTVMQIEKVLINDRLRVSKVS